MSGSPRTSQAFIFPQVECLGRNDANSGAPGYVTNLRIKVGQRASLWWKRLCKLFSPWERKAQSSPGSMSAEDILTLLEGFQNVPKCEEYRKMVIGEQYKVATSRELQVARISAETFCSGYNNTVNHRNQTTDDVRDKRTRDLKAFLGKMPVDREIVIEPPVFFAFGCNVELGANCQIERNAQFFDSAPVILGSNVIVGPNVTFMTEFRPVSVLARRHRVAYAKPIRVGDDCWIGEGVTILGGVIIGKGCTVGAKSLVNKDIEEGSVVVGAPVRVIQKVALPETPTEASRCPSS